MLKLVVTEGEIVVLGEGAWVEEGCSDLESAHVWWEFGDDFGDDVVIDIISITGGNGGTDWVLVASEEMVGLTANSDLGLVSRADIVASANGL